MCTSFDFQYALFFSLDVVLTIMTTNKKSHKYAQVFRIYGFQILSISTGLTNLIMVAMKILFISFVRRNSVSVLWEKMPLHHMRMEDYTFQEYQIKPLCHSFQGINEVIVLGSRDLVLPYRRQAFIQFL